jgi:hypothetical protein
VSNLAFVIGAVLLSALGTFIIWFRHRKPRSMQSGIEEFAKELKALAPERRESEGGRG